MGGNSDTLVIGGGIIGLSVALRVRQAGLSVTLLERGVCGYESSWAAAGILAPGNPHRKDSLYTIHCASLERYPQYCAEIAEISGIDPEYDRCGELKLLTTEQHVQMAKSDVRVTADKKMNDDLPSLELLTPEQCRRIEPKVTGEALAVLHNRITAQIRNPRLLQGLRVSCERLGVSIHERTPAASMILAGSRVAGAQAEDGTRYAAGHTVLCAGAWSNQIAQCDITGSVPVHPVRGQIVLLQMRPPPFTHVIERRRTYLVCRPDGMTLLGATVEPEAGFDNRPTAKGVDELMAAARAMADCIGEASVVAVWAGLRPGTPDKRPYIGPVPGYEGLIAATGHYRSGLAFAPITADIVRDLIVDGRCDFDLSRCAPGRKPRSA